MLRIAGRQRPRGRRALSCNRRPSRSFQLRVTAPPTGPRAAPQAGAAYLGASDAIVADGLPAPVVLRLTGSATRVAARWVAVAPCGRGPRERFTNFTPSTPVKGDGTFGRSERFTQRFSDALVRYRVVFSGGFTTDGATGTLRVRTAVYDRRGRKLRTRCDSGERTWSALLGGG